MLTRCCFLLCVSTSIPRPKDEFEIAEIVGEYRDGPHLYYLVAWKGYPASTNTWHAVEDLPHAKEAIARFAAQGKVVPQCRLPVQYQPRAVDSYPAAAAKPAFVLSGMNPAERPAQIALIDQLGGTVITDEELNADEFDWDRVTHVVCAAHPINGLKRSMKVFMCITWGIHMTRTTYLLHPSFLTQSKELGRFAEEKDFLWATHPELLTNGTPPSLIRRIQLSARPPIGREEYDYDPVQWRPPHVCIGYARMDDNRERTRLLIQILRRKFNDTPVTFVDLDAEPDKLHECTRIVYGSEPTDEDLRQLVRAQNRQLDEYRARTNNYINDRLGSSDAMHIVIGWLIDHILEGHNDDITEHPTTGEEHFTHHPRQGPPPARHLFYTWDTSPRLRRITTDVIAEVMRAKRMRLKKSTRSKRRKSNDIKTQGDGIEDRAKTRHRPSPLVDLTRYGIEPNPGPSRCAVCEGEFPAAALCTISIGIDLCSRCRHLPAKPLPRLGSRFSSASCSDSDEPLSGIPARAPSGLEDEALELTAVVTDDSAGPSRAPTCVINQQPDDQMDSATITPTMHCSKRVSRTTPARMAAKKKRKREQLQSSANRSATPPSDFAYAVIGDNEPLCNALVLKPTRPYPPTPVLRILQHDAKYARETGKHEYIVVFDVADPNTLQPNLQYPVETLFPRKKWGRLAGMNHPMVRAFHDQELQKQSEKRTRRSKSAKLRDSNAAL